MHFEELKKYVLKRAKNYEKRYKLKIDQEFAMIKLMEEMGEFSQAVLIHRRQSRPEKFLPKKESKYEVAKELADVVCMAVLNAQLMGIDLEQAIKDKWVND